MVRSRRISSRIFKLFSEAKDVVSLGISGFTRRRTKFYYPVVPKGQARIRVQVSAGHTIEQLDRCIAAFTKVGKELNVIK